MESDLCVPKRTTKRPKAPWFSGKRSPSREGVGTKTSASPQAKPHVSQKEPRGAAQRRTLQVFRGNGLVTKGARQGIEEGSSSHCVSPSLGPVGLGEFLRPASLVAWGLRPLQNSPCSPRVARLARDGHRANAGETTPREGFSIPMRAGITALVGRARTSKLSAEVGRRRRSNETAPQRQWGRPLTGT